MADKNKLGVIGDHGGEYLNLTQAVTYTGLSRITLHRRIADGKLRSQIVNGRHRVALADLDALFGPAPVLGNGREASDETLKEWAARMASVAPPLRPEQRDIVLSAFSAALVTVGGN